MSSPKVKLKPQIDDVMMIVVTEVDRLGDILCPSHISQSCSME